MQSRSSRVVPRAQYEPVLEEWLEQTISELAAYDEANPDAPSAPFAVNQIVHGSNARLKHDMDMCVKYKVPIVITSLGAEEWVNGAQLWRHRVA